MPFRRARQMKSAFTYPAVVLCWLWLLLQPAQSSDRTSVPCSKPPNAIRVATFNVSLHRSEPGQLQADLRNNDPRVRKIAAILRTVQPDIVLLNEFDYDVTQESVALLQRNFLQNPESDLPTLTLPYSYTESVNTGVPSGLDLNGNGTTDDPADAFGFGQFPGQYGMLLLSRFPVNSAAVRTFQKLRWSAMPRALKPVDPSSGQPWYAPDTWAQLRLSSKSHWDVPVQIGRHTLHVLASHPTPPAFDGPEDRNGCRNHDEIRLWADYLSPQRSAWLRDDAGRQGGLPLNRHFVVVGDLNADPLDGGSRTNAIGQLLQHPRINAAVVPRSTGGLEASRLQGHKNEHHRGDPAADTADFNDRSVGNLRVDYVLPGSRLSIVNTGVFWPASSRPEAQWLSASDHRLVWVDLEFPSHESSPSSDSDRPR